MEDFIEENRKLSEALNGVLYDNELYKNQMSDMKGTLQKMQNELSKLKNKA